MEMNKARKVDGVYYRFERGSCDNCCCLGDADKCAFIANELEDCEDGCFKEYSREELYKVLTLEWLKTLNPNEFAEQMHAGDIQIDDLINQFLG